MENTEILMRAFNILTPREKTIIRMRMFENKSLEEVGKELDVTRERIRQMENKAAELFIKAINTFGLPRRHSTSSIG